MKPRSTEDSQYVTDLHGSKITVTGVMNRMDFKSTLNMELLKPAMRKEQDL